MVRAGRKNNRRAMCSSIKQGEQEQMTLRTERVRILSDDQVCDIHDRTMQFLEESGMKVQSIRARQILRDVGAQVDDANEMVRIDRGSLENLLSTAPASFVLHSRNSERSLEIGGDKTVFMSVASAPNVSDLKGGRRPGSYVDFQNMVRLSHELNVVNAFGGNPVEPTDLPVTTRHLDCNFDFLTLSDKPFRLYAIGATRIEDGLEMNRIAQGLSNDDLETRAVAITNVNINSPLLIDEAMLDGLIAMSSRNQPVIITPFTLAGAMAPVSMAGAILQQNIEAVMGIAITQAVRPGAPVLYGCFTSNVDMKSGAPAFGTPENVRAIAAGGQMARHYNVPFRASNANASNAMDAQAAYESLFSLQAAVGGHANLIQHAVGWLEGGLTASFEKMVLDAELIQSLMLSHAPIDTSEAEYGLEAMRDVGPGGHFFGTQHTLDRYEKAFYAPILSDWRNFGAWTEAGAPDAFTRAAKISDDLLKAYTKPAMEPAIYEELQAFVARRKEEGGATDAVTVDVD
ncbi:trimethylamine methyltransferase family protein [Litoreibacter sp.]|nr:trimethylamine methyltransferase family protein [Litoreibacter sp.]